MRFLIRTLSKLYKSHTAVVKTAHHYVSAQVAYVGIVNYVFSCETVLFPYSQISR